MEKPIYIVLTDTGTVLSKAIGLYTRHPLNHVSIAFDVQLNEMYSFGRKQHRNSFIGGFVREQPTEGVFKHADCAIYGCHVTVEQYRKVRRIIRHFERNSALYKYNFIGLFGVTLNRPIRRKRAYFCSQFVATVMNKCWADNKPMPPHLTMPHHFENLPYLTLLYKGKLQNYLRATRGRVTDPAMKEGLRKQFVC